VASFSIYSDKSSTPLYVNVLYDGEKFNHKIINQFSDTTKLTFYSKITDGYTGKSYAIDTIKVTCLP
jgi:hypothetical protein